MSQGVRWEICELRCRCMECRERIEAGERMALWTEVCVGEIRAITEAVVILHHHLNRRYCESCGELLEDSLTTTEAA